MAPVVAFCRTLQVGSKGADVVAHKRALSRATPTLYEWSKFTDYFGENFESAIKKYQRRHAIPATGKIGSTTHKSLVRQHRAGHPDEWAFDTIAIDKASGFCHEFTKTPEQRVREAGVAAAFFWYSKRLVIAYSQFRPFQVGKPPWIPSRWDCSAFATNCHFAAGAPDPNGRNYDHLGYTGTLMSRGTRVAKVGLLKPLDLIFYGSTTKRSPGFEIGDPTHVAVYVGLINGVPSVLSHGHYPMALYPYNYRSINHFRHYTVA